MANLCLLTDDGDVAEQWEIRHRPLAIGRGESVDIKIDDDGLSRRHFMIFREGEEYLIKDLSSRNGTWVSGARALTTTLRHNDSILAGRSLFRFFEPEPAMGPHDTVVIATR